MSKPRVVIVGAGFGGLGCARELVALADVRNFPVMQVYARGTLRTTRPINSKALFDEFYARLEDLVLEFADFGATVEGAG